ncbi:DUF445 domain-containing protein [Staphylococcus ratti]|uniref:DUF445 family protein n=1 Tax=Staphylococcus ratti TaxID=2892440 RepID=A0ABY3PEU3_9STAP|nr:DUF445 family protein [Staphylococcus ratti]UEX90856.1 DUF445 family protein [Staphylococcus ratti]
MKILLVVIFMTIIGAVIGGVTNMIAVKMLFHPFKPYYIFGKRVPFTPGLVPKRRAEIATKIGQVVEEHLLTEALIREKLASHEVHTSIYHTVQHQIDALKGDHVTLQTLVEPFDIDLAKRGAPWLSGFLDERLEQKYNEVQTEKVAKVLPQALIEAMDKKVSDVDSLLLERAKVYIASDKGYQDMYEMIESFFTEKSRIFSALQMFMTKDAIVERIQVELLRLADHPKAQRILKAQIEAEYERFKSLPINEVMSAEQFAKSKPQFVEGLVRQVDIQKHVHQPLNRLVPQLLDYLSNEGATKITNTIIDLLAQRLSLILKKINIANLVKEQIDRFDLDYIERLIFEIANKELKLIMLLGFILGGIIGFFQGLIAIFV